jgi:hypothetical protein
VNTAIKPLLAKLMGPISRKITPKMSKIKKIKIMPYDHQAF